MIYCGMATIIEREQSLWRVLDKLLPQVDVLYLVLNNYEYVPKKLQALRKVRAIVGNNNLRDTGKHLFADLHDEGYFVTWDDDIVPVDPNCIKTLIDGVETYKCICTLHGKRYTSPITSYNRGWSLRVQCRKPLPHDTWVNVGGTGCMAYDLRQVRVNTDDFPLPSMSDLWFSIAAKRQGVKIMALKHDENMIEHIDHGEDTIWHTFTKKNDEFLAGLVNKYLLAK